MNSLFTIALMFKVLDSATAPVRKINETLDTTGKNLDKAAGKSTALNSGIDRLGIGAGIAGRVATGVDRIGKAAEVATAKLDALQKKTEKMGESAQKLDGLGRPLAATGAVGALGIEKTIKDFANLEDAQKQLRVTLMDEVGKVGPEYEKLNALGEKLGTDLPGSTKDMLNMFTALREQGVKTNYILGGVGEAAAKFAVLMKVDFASGATSVAKFAEAMGIDDSGIVKFMDTLSRLKTAAGVDVAGLGETFRYLGATLKTLKIQGQPAALETAAAIGMLAQNSLDGSTAGTNYANALASLAKMNDKLEGKKIQQQIAPILNKHNIKLNFFDNAGEFVGQRKMIAELEKLNVLSSVDKMNVLNRLFSVEGGRALSVYVEKGVKGLDEMLEKMRKQADMDTKIKELMSSTSKKWETMTGTVENLSAHLGGVFAKIINLPGILDRMNNLFAKMDSWVLLHPKTAGVIAGVIVGVTGLSIAGGALLLTVAGLGAAVPRALEGLTVLGQGATWATGRFTALYLSMRRKWVLNKLPDSMFGDVIPGAAKAQTGIRGVIASTRLWIVTQLSALKTSYLAAGGLTGLARSFAGGLVSGIRAAMIAMRAFSLSLLTNPVGWIALAIGVAALVIYKHWKPISGFFKGLWQGLKEGLKGLEPAWDIFKRVAPILFPILIPLKWIFNAVRALFKPVDDVGGKAQNMGLRFGRAIGGILSSVLQLPAKMLTAGANIIDSLFKGMMSKIEKPISAMKGLAQRLRNFLPFSPAKEGALRDINRVRIVETIAESMRPTPLVNAMKGVTAAAMIAAAPATSLAQSATTPVRPAVATLARPAASSASGAMTVTFSPQITIQGGGNAEQVKSQVGEAMKLSFVEFERMMKRYEEQKQRRAF